MTRQSDRPQTARHILIYDEDWDMLKHLFDSRTGVKQVGVSAVVKSIIHQYCGRFRQKYHNELDQRAGVGAAEEEFE